MIEVFANKEELEKALAKLNELEERGLGASLAGFKISTAGKTCGDDLIHYNSQFIIKADPEDKKKNWGRISEQMIEWYRYENGKLIE